MIKRYNEAVSPDDTVYHLGDFSLRHATIPSILSRLNGTKHLVSGNHDQTHPVRSKHKKMTLQYIDYGFASVQEKLELKIGDHIFLLQHLPFLKEGEDQRFPDWRPKNGGQFLLCGHIHEKWKINGRQINVGVDQWDFRPVSEAQILEVVADILEFEQV